MSEGNGKAPSLEALNEERRLLRAKAAVARARQELALTEGAGDGLFGMGYGDYLSPWLFQHDAFGRPWMPLNTGGPSAKRGGHNTPFVDSDADLDRMRGLAQWLCTKNDIAIGIMRTLGNFTVKRGYEWDTRPTPGNEDNARAVLLAGEVKALIDRHDKLNKLKRRERSHFTRAVRDGDTMTRHFARADGMTLVRPVRAEQLRDPGTRGPHCSFGIETEEGDVETALCYHVTYDGGGSFEEVAPDSVSFYKRNADEEVKRGLSDFYSAGEGLDDVYKLLRNMRKGGGVLAAIAWIEEYDSASRDQIAAASANLRDINRPRIDHPLTGRPIDYQQMEPGTIVRTGKGKQYKPPPLAGNTTNFEAIVQACLRAVGMRWSMAEYMSSGFMGNVAELSILAAGSPFVNSIECEQYDIGDELFLRWRWIAVRNACRAGLIRATLEEVQALVDIHYTPPLVAVANELEQAQIDHMDIGAGVMSIPTRRARRKLDDEQERKNNKEEPPTRVTGKVADVDPQGNPTGAERGGRGAPAPGEGRPFPAAEGARRRGVTPLYEAGKSGEFKDKRGRRYCLGDGGRVKCAPRPEGDGGRGRGRPAGEARPSVEDVTAHAGGVVEGGSGDGAKRLGVMLSRLTVPEIRQVRQALGIAPKGRRKDDIIAHIEKKAAERVTESERWDREARKAGVAPREMRRAASEMQRLSRQHSREVQEVLKAARAAYKASEGVTLTRAHPAIREEAGPDALPGLERVARGLADRYPHVLGAHGYETGDNDSTAAARRLYDYLLAGAPAVGAAPKWYGEALAYLKGQPRTRGARQPEEVPF